MFSLSVTPKLVSEARTEALDISASLGPLDVPSTASVTLAVYSGTDTSPSSIVGAPTVDASFNLVNLPLLAGGVAGCLYQGVLALTLLAGGQKFFTFFLAVVPDAV